MPGSGSASGSSASDDGTHSAEAAAAATAAVATATTQLNAILSSQDTIPPEIAQDVTSFVSDLIAVQASTGTTMADETSTQLRSAVTQLAKAATPGGGVVQLSSPNLNLTTESRPLSELALTPVTCETASDVAAEVALPSNVLGAVSGLNASQPIAVLLYTTPQLLNPIDTTAGAGVRSSRNVSASSPLVSFSLVQAGHPLRVAGAEKPINVSLPLNGASPADEPSAHRRLSEASDDGSAGVALPCIGMPSNLSSVACMTALECRWWDEAHGNWSAAGCTTVLSGEGGLDAQGGFAAAALTCSCTHLTDFVVFEFPTSSEELLADLSAAVAINGFSQAALECIASPRFEKIPGVWAIDLSLLCLAFFFLWRSSQRDEEEIKLVEMLVKGRRLERRQRFRNVAAAVLARRPGSMARSAAGGAAGQCKTGGAAFARTAALSSRAGGDNTSCAAAGAAGRSLLAIQIPLPSATGDASGRAMMTPPEEGSEEGFLATPPENPPQASPTASQLPIATQQAIASITAPLDACMEGRPRAAQPSSDDGRTSTEPRSSSASPPKTLGARPLTASEVQHAKLHARDDTSQPKRPATAGASCVAAVAAVCGGRSRVAPPRVAPTPQGSVRGACTSAGAGAVTDGVKRRDSHIDAGAGPGGGTSADPSLVPAAATIVASPPANTTAAASTTTTRNLPAIERARAGKQPAPAASASHESMTAMAPDASTGALTAQETEPTNAFREVPVPAAFDSTATATYQSSRIPRQESEGRAVRSTRVAKRAGDPASGASTAAVAAAPSAAFESGRIPRIPRAMGQAKPPVPRQGSNPPSKQPKLGELVTAAPSTAPFESVRIPRMVGQRKAPLPKLPRAADLAKPLPPPPAAANATNTESSSKGGSTDPAHTPASTLPATPPPSPPPAPSPDAVCGSEKLVEQGFHRVLTQRGGAFSPLHDEQPDVAWSGIRGGQVSSGAPGPSSGRPGSSGSGRSGSTYSSRSGGWLSAASPLRPASPPPPPRPLSSSSSQPPRVFLRPERPRLTPKLPSVGKGGPLSAGPLSSSSRRARFASGGTGSFNNLADDDIEDIVGIEDETLARPARPSSVHEGGDDDCLLELPTLPSAPHSAISRPPSSGHGAGRGALSLGCGDGRRWGRSTHGSMFAASAATPGGTLTSTRTPGAGIVASARTPGGSLIARIAESPACKTLGSAVREVRRRMGADRSRRYHAVSANENWIKARRLKAQIVLVRRWHGLVNRCDKRLWLEFKRSHTLLAGVVFRGTSGYTRAQTTQILINSLALELVVLCMFYSSPSDGPMVINPITIIVSGAMAAAICIPGMLVFAMCFHPGASVQRLARCFLCWPCRLATVLQRCCRRHDDPHSEHSFSHYTGISRRSNIGGVGSEASETVAKGVELSEAERGSVSRCMAAGSEASEGVGLSGAECVSVAQGCLDGGGGGGLAEDDSAGGKERVSPAPRSPESLDGLVQRPPPLLIPLASDLPSERDDEGLEEESSPIPALPPPQERYYSYASLNEHMLALSLRRCMHRKDWPGVRQIVTGWTLNWMLLLGLIVVFSIYGCEFYSIYAEQTNGEMLLMSWAFSIGMRFLINEPFLICASKGVPMLFASAFCANLCGESIVTCLSLLVDGTISFVRALTAM